MTSEDCRDEANDTASEFDAWDWELFEAKAVFGDDAVAELVQRQDAPSFHLTISKRIDGSVMATPLDGSG